MARTGRTRPSPTLDLVINLLSIGPKTREELEKATGKRLQSTLYDMKRKKLIHVHEWLRGTGNMKAYRMVFAIGDLPDAERPPADRSGTMRRYYANHKPEIKEKRRQNFQRYKKKLAEAQRRLRAKQRLVSNPFLQLAPQLFTELRKKADKRRKSDLATRKVVCVDDE